MADGLKEKLEQEAYCGHKAFNTVSYKLKEEFSANCFDCVARLGLVVRVARAVVEWDAEWLDGMFPNSEMGNELRARAEKELGK